MKKRRTNFRLGQKVKLIDYFCYPYGQCLIKGKVTKIYWGKENGEPCVGLVIDKGNGYLIDSYIRVEIDNDR